MIVGKAIIFYEFYSQPRNSSGSGKSLQDYQRAHEIPHYQKRKIRGENLAKQDYFDRQAHERSGT
jgi:hypothetical protein